jgi:hypothetical protein
MPAATPLAMPAAQAAVSFDSTSTLASATTERPPPLGARTAVMQAMPPVETLVEGGVSASPAPEKPDPKRDEKTSRSAKTQPPQSLRSQARAATAVEPEKPKTVAGPRLVVAFVAAMVVVAAIAVFGRLKERGVDYDLPPAVASTSLGAPSPDPSATSPIADPSSVVAVPNVARPVPTTLTIGTVGDVGDVSSSPPPPQPPPAHDGDSARRASRSTPDVTTHTVTMTAPPDPRPAPRPQPATPPVTPPPATPAPQPTPVVQAAPPPETPPAATPGTGNATRDAQKALDRGDTTRAIDYARKATSADPSNAEAWLTLGAAYEAAGRASLARGAYQSCVAHGKGERVSECRALVGQ